MVAHTSEIMGNGETLDKELKGVNNKIDNIKEDGTLIASKTKLGNVKIGDNITVSDDGTISVIESGLNSSEISDGMGLVKTQRMSDINDDEWTHLSLGYSTDSQVHGKFLLERKATTEDYGVVKVGSGLSINAETGALDCTRAVNYTLVDLRSSISASSIQSDGEIQGGSWVATLTRPFIENKTKIAILIPTVAGSSDNTYVLAYYTGMEPVQVYYQGSQTIYRYSVIIRFGKYYLKLNSEVSDLLDLYKELYGIDIRDYES